MKNLNLIIIAVLIIVLGFRTDNAEKFHLKKYKNKFKQKNLNAFVIDQSIWNSRNNNFALDSALFIDVWQGEMYFNTNDTTYFYSLQDNPRGLQEITVILDSKGIGCMMVYYLIFNQHGEQISNFIAAAVCGEGGGSLETHGKFLNDSVYQQWNYSTGFYGFYNDKSIREYDSTMYNIKILKNGELEYKMLQSMSGRDTI